MKGCLRNFLKVGPLINSIIRPRYAQGILADIFIPYLQRYMSEVANNGGISSGLQQNSGSGIILNGANILGGVADLRSLALVKKAIQKTMLFSIVFSPFWFIAKIVMGVCASTFCCQCFACSLTNKGGLLRRPAEKHCWAGRLGRTAEDDC